MASLIYMLIFVLNPCLYAQVIDGESKDVIFRSRVEIEAAAPTPQNPLVITMANPYYNSGFSNSDQEYEIALVYKKDALSDLSNQYWAYTIHFSLNPEPGNISTINEYTLDVNNFQNEAKHEDVLRSNETNISNTITVTITSLNTYIEAGQLPADIYFEIRLVHNNKKDPIIVGTPPLSHTLSFVKDENYYPTGGKHQASIKWSDATGADYYELAYTFIDAEDKNIYTDSKARFDQAIIVETKNNWYDIDLTYPKGTLYVWVRQVFLEDDFIITPLDWAYANPIVIPIAGFETSLNWKAQSSFAEEGKSKKVVDFYDKSLRPQQTITYLNDEKVALVAETDYDLEGRASIQVLPAPSIAYDYTGQNYANNLFFKPNFNKSNTNVPYNFLNHEKLTADPVSNLAGAGQYFSSQNNSKSIHRNFIPDAEGYPLVQTKYMRDNTGRIASQSGVGDDFKLGSGHETKYFYVNATETELNALFGGDIGDHKHYKKTITIDPNGQASASYSDMSGKVIATSLLGKSPTNVLALESQPTTTEKVLSLVTNQASSRNSIKASNTFVKIGAEPEIINFKYSYEGVGTNIPGFCVTCPYNVTIKLIDPCGDLVSIGPDGETEQTLISGLGTLIPDNGQNCINNNHSGTIEFSANLTEEGSYSILKEITSEFSYSLLSTAVSGAIDEDQIKATIAAQMDPFLCELTCEQYCEYLHQGNSQALASCLDSCSIAFNIDQIENQIESACNSTLSLMANQIENELPVIINQNSEAVTINGDYIDYSLCISDAGGTLDIKDINGDSYIWNINDGTLINITNNTPLANNDEISMPKYDGTGHTNIARVNFINNLDLFFKPQIAGSLWQPQFADALIGCHREFCHYSRCIQMTESEAYNTTLSDLEDINAAAQKYQVPNFASNAERFNILIEKIRLNDPFFTTSSICLGYNKIQALNDLLANYEYNFEGDICTAINLTSQTCNYNGIMIYLSQYLTTVPDNNNTPIEKTMWQIVMSSYIHFKQVILNNQNCNPNPVCIFQTDEHKIFEKPITSGTQNYASFKELYDNVNNPPPNTFNPITSITAGSVDGLLDLYEDEFIPVGQQTAWRNSSYFNELKLSIENYINNKCNKSSSDNYETSMMPYENMVTFQNLCVFSGIQGYSTDAYPPNAVERFTSSPVSLLSYSSNASFISELDDVTSDPNFKSSSSEAHGIFLVRAVNGNGKERLVIKNFNNGNANLTHIGVRVYRSVCDYENLKFITAQMFGNVNGDIVLDIPEDIGGNIIFDIFSRDPNFSSKYFTIEFYANFNFQVSDYFDYQQTSPINIIHNNDLKDVYDKADAGNCEFNDPNCVFLGDEWISKVWECEGMCADIDPCMELIISTIQDWIDDAYTSGMVNSSTNLYSVSIPSTPNGCYTSIDFKHYIPAGNLSDTWWFEVYGASILSQNPNEAVILRFVTGEGLVPNFFVDAVNSTFPGQSIHNCTELNIINYSPTAKDYSFIDPNINTSAYIVPNIKFLLKTNIRPVENGECASPESSGTPFFQTAYMVIDKKVGIEYTDLVKSCDVFVSYDDWQDDCKADSLALLTMLTNIEVERQKNEIVSQVLSLDCMSGVAETFTKTDDAYRDHHFTLYYYDQVGNLVKTIPPSDVELLVTNFDTNGKWTGGNTQPTHTKATTYEYNSFNQITKSVTPDAGMTTFHYDKLQRLRFSQNAQQLIDGDVSYTLFDDLSRVIETGEWHGDLSTALANIDDPLWPNGTLNKADIVATTYSIPVSNSINHGIYRGRVTSANRIYPDGNVFSHYGYDSHGNVNLLVQKVGDLPEKIIKYKYDLISGNVSKISFNDLFTENYYDQFYQRYKYDANNRLTSAFSSLDDIVWNEDARYFYYLHGPLARVEYGNDKVQGLDYFYTMQGWIKGLNAHGDNAFEWEPGLDGNAYNGFLSTGINSRSGRDALAYSLGYYQNDFSAIGNIDLGYAQAWNNFGPNVLPNVGNKGLYNGNIATMITDHKGHISNLQNISDISGYAYQYDQLHRIRQAKNYTYPNVNSDNSFKTQYTYNPDGNLTSLIRYGNNGSIMDNFSNYMYNIPNHPNNDQPNTLKQIEDDPNISSLYEGDFDGTQTYTYDKIGNLIYNTDKNTTILWDVYNKIKSTSSNTGTTSYKYDALGNRVFSTDGVSEKYYVRDAGGNMLSVFGPLSGFRNNAHIQLECHLYGSNRIGINKVLRLPNDVIPWKDKVGSNTPTSTHYELSNHLGNVLTTVTGRKKGIDTNIDGTVDHYEPEVVQASDYYPFGSEMPGRTYRNPLFSGTNDYRFGFNGKELDKSDEFGSLTHYDYGFRIYNPSIGKFLSVDPLASKYPNESPYNYVSNNPILFIDPDGREKIIGFDKNKKDDQVIIAGAEKYQDDGAIHIFGHGNTKGIYLVMDGKKVSIESPEQLNSFLNKNSETWQNKGDEKPMIVLHSCNTGRDQNDGSASFAEKVSGSELFKDATIVAPNERDYFSENGETGTYKAKYADKNGVYKTDENGAVKSKERSDTPGSWRLFKNGEQIEQYRGDWKPKEQPTLWDKLTKKED
jgi:RHS repeat-associated protein